MSETNFSLIDLKALSKPAEKLIESVSIAIGALYEPTKIRRKAKADADAAVILAKNQEETQEIEVRASERLRNREVRRQKNIEGITRNALDELPASVSDTPVDEDWIYQFFENCQDISNEQMQSLWSKLLAGEVTAPGKFSLRTLNLVKNLREEDAHIFTKFCTFVWKSSAGPIPFILDIENELVKNTGLNFSTFLHLDSLGLINFDNITGFELKDTSTILLRYFDKRYVVALPEGQTQLKIGTSLLTIVGKELFPISGAKKSENHLSEMINKWHQQGLQVVENNPPS